MERKLAPSPCHRGEKTPSPFSPPQVGVTPTRPEAKTRNHCGFAHGQCPGCLQLQSPRCHTCLLGPEPDFSPPSHPLTGDTCPVLRQPTSHGALPLPPPAIPWSSCVPITHARPVSATVHCTAMRCSLRDREPQEFQKRAPKASVLGLWAQPWTCREQTSLLVTLQHEIQGKRAV